MLTRLRFEYVRCSARLVQWLHNSFYLYLALLLTCGVLFDAALLHVGENMKQKAFDFVVRHRIRTPQPDPDIVIVDVNEASLAALGPDYGRWPWPRQVFGEFLQSVEAQKPKAVVFDILFADADLYNPDSDAYFNDSVAGYDNVFFPFLRLAEAHDRLSKVKPAMIPGVQQSGPQAQPDATVAVVLPHFSAALRAGRLGTHNIYPDADGIVREYRLWRDDYGWRLPSLPLAVGRGAGMKKPPATDSLLLNWRGGPFSYRYVSFSDVYRDLSAKKPQRPANEFTGKIIIIGSTAPSLFDLKATPMAKMHPGVEILATAIDNLKRGDPLRFWRGPLGYIGLSLLLVWLTAAAFYRNVERYRFDRLFGMSQLLLLAISYIGVSLADIYIDLTAPVSWAVVCFSIAKVYAMATERTMQRVLAAQAPAGGSGTPVALLLVQLETAQPLGDAVLRKIRHALEQEAHSPCSIDEPKGAQTGIWGLFSDMLAVAWAAEGPAVQQEAGCLLAVLPDILARHGLPERVAIRHVILHGTLSVGRDAAAQWRILFAQAIMQLETQPAAQNNSLPESS